jgi:hypothetical protein
MKDSNLRWAEDSKGNHDLTQPAIDIHLRPAISDEPFQALLPGLSHRIQRAQIGDLYLTTVGMTRENDIHLIVCGERNDLGVMGQEDPGFRFRAR